MSKVMVQVRGATGFLDVPLSSFVFKTEEPVPSDSNRRLLSPALITVLIMVGVLLVVLAVVYYVRKSMMKSRRSLVPSELESIDKSDYTMVPSVMDDDRKHLKKHE